MQEDQKKEEPAPIQKMSTEGQIVVQERVNQPNGEVKVTEFVRGNFLGKGGFAKCYEFTRVNDRTIFAGKLIAKSSLTKSRARQKLLSEIKIHRSLVHKHVVGFEHFFEDYENVYILLELCTSQSMNELLRRRKRLHELEVQCYTVQMISALKYMHAHKVIHRDLKLGNLFLNDKMEVKIGDFGLATKLEFDGDRKRTICGTPNYIAPEILEGKNGHSYEVDLWSLGVIIYTLLIGKPPFETADVKTTYQRIKKNQFSFPENIKVSRQSKHLVQMILQLDPTQRPSLNDILEHEFFHMGHAIPKNLPSSTLACPPSEKYIKQYMPLLGKAESMADLGKGRLSESGKENARKGKDGQMTDRGRGLLSPTEPLLNEKRVSQNGKRHSSVPRCEWNESEEPFLKKCVDYSNKYGVGYSLTNGSKGVYFNDGSKIILDPNGIVFDYFEKDQAKQETRTSYTLKAYAQALQKKVTLLLHFKGYLDGKQDPPAKSDFSTFQNTTDRAIEDPVYVKKWLKTKHAILFRLSNKVVQVNFEDGTELCMSSRSKKVSYLNKKSQRCSYMLTSALESDNQEMIKRLNYARQVLEHSLKAEVGPQTQRAVTSKPTQNEDKLQHQQLARQSSRGKFEPLDSQNQLRYDSNGPDTKQRRTLATARQ